MCVTNVSNTKVLNILSEIVMGGMVLETNMHEICSRFQEQDKLEKSEVINFIYQNSLL